MNIDAAKSYALEFLKINAGSQFHYHNLAHTLDVYQSVTLIAESEKISASYLALLQVAALYHDLGIMIKYHTHEEDSIKIARLVLPGFDFKSDDIDTISRFIADTHIPSFPKSELGKLLCDADLDYMGRNDYFEISERLKLEWETLGIKKYTYREWNLFQLDFLSKHEYFTKSARQTRNKGKVLNIKKISELLKKV
jgi:predicted metal-dependent HD superfamily phosphohydrolase